MQKITFPKASPLLIFLNIIFIGIATFSHSAAQSRFTTEEISITVKGTSTLHDWEMESNKAESETVFSLNEKGQPEHLESVAFKLNKGTLKSDKSGLDRRAYEAMNAKRHPEIIFRTTGGGAVKQNGDNFNVTTSGDLTIAGVTRRVSVDATCINGDNDKLVCSGTSQLKMSDFNIDPPVMFLGTLRTGDEIKIEYRMVYTTPDKFSAN
jgi:hypothetical protein